MQSMLASESSGPCAAADSLVRLEGMDGRLPVSALEVSYNTIWDAINAEKDLNMPTHQVCFPHPSFVAVCEWLMQTGLHSHGTQDHGQRQGQQPLLTLQ